MIFETGNFPFPPFLHPATPTYLPGFFLTPLTERRKKNLRQSKTATFAYFQDLHSLVYTAPFSDAAKSTQRRHDETHLLRVATALIRQEIVHRVTRRENRAARWTFSLVPTDILRPESKFQQMRGCYGSCLSGPYGNGENFAPR